MAASAALPALTLLAQDAEAAYGDNRKWCLGEGGAAGCWTLRSAVLVPLTTLVFPMVAFGSFVRELRYLYRP